MTRTYFTSSIGKKQVVAVTGLLLILFILGHLAGNLLIYLGPDAYNGYAKKLAGLRPGLYLIEFGLAVIFLIHMLFTALLVLQNIRARGTARYAAFQPKTERSITTRMMPFTGSALLAFLVWHLLDFTLIDHHGPRGLINGEDLGVYGVVYNAFTNPVHSVLYILAMLSLGFHLYHGIQSFVQTFGWRHPVWAPVIRNFSYSLSIIITFAYCSIPVYVYTNHYLQKFYQ